MPVLHQLQPSFNNGEISPLLYDRVDFKKFVSSVKSGKNMFVHPQGGMSNRAGTVMLAQAKQENVRLIPFEFSSTETYVIEFGNYYCRFYTADGQVVSEGQPYEIESPFATEDLSNIRYCQSGDVMYLAWGGEPKKLVRYGHTNWMFEKYDYKNGPVNFYNEKKGTLSKTQATASFDYIMSLNDSNVYSSLNLTDWTLLNVDYNIGNYAHAVGSYLFSVEYVDGQGFMVYSSDGVGWSRLGNNIKATRYFQIYYINGIYYLYTGANNLDGNSNFYTFSTFSDITARSVPFGTISGGINYQNNLFFVYANVAGTSYSRTFVSSDFVSWTNTNTSISSDSKNIFFSDGYYFSFAENSTNVSRWNTSYSYIGSFYLPYNFRRGASVDNKIYLDLFVANTTTDYIYVLDSSNFSCSKIFEEGGMFWLYGNSNNFLSTDTNLYQLNTSTDSFSLIQKNVSGYVRNFVPFHFNGTQSKYSLSSSDYSFSQQDIYKKFILEVEKPADSVSVHLSFSQGTYNNRTQSFFCNGEFLLKTSGTWEGTVSIEYSEDNVVWTVFREYASTSSANFEIPVNLGKAVFVRAHYSISTRTGGGNTDFGLTLSINSSLFLVGLDGLEYSSSSLMYVAPESSTSVYIDYLLSIQGKFYISHWFYPDSFPQDVELYQDRIVWATNNQLDATKISDYENFGVSADVTEDDAISVIVKDKKVDRINSLIAGQKLAVYSDDGNFVHNNDTFTPNSATFLKQGATGGSDVKPVVVRDHIIYAHPMKQAISDYAYNFETDGYAGQDITLLAHHLFNGKVIKTLAYQQEPYSIIWVLQEEGNVLACTYLRQQDVIAWTPMDFGGEVQSIAVCSAGTEENLYVAVKRNNGTFVEKMETRLLSMDPKESFFVDCGRTYRGEPATVISGLDYLEGEEVVALADGNVVKDLTVENGSITLQHAASVVTVGLPYESVLETLTFDANTGDGSNLNRKKRVVAVSVRYNNSRGTRISVNGHREVDMLKRGQEGYNVPISLKSGFYREIVASTHNEATTVKIRQDEPLPLTVVSVIPEIEYEK